MSRLIRENAAIVVGVGLPILVVVLFLVASYLPSLWTEPPRHDLVLKVENGPVRYAARLVRVDLSVEGERLRARVYKLDPSTPQRAFVPVPSPQQLFVWSHETGTLREVELPIPADLDAVDNGAALPLGELGERRIDTSLVAPDGYEYRALSQRRDGVFGLFFGGGEQQLVIEKAGARVAIDLPAGLGYWNVHFLGWVVE